MKYVLCILVLYTGLAFAEEHLVNVQKFGAVADARRVGQSWVGTDNSSAFNRAAAHCRKNGLTLLVPKGNYGVASTVWLTDPQKDGLKQATISIQGSNRGAYADQEYSANICVLREFKPGKWLEVKKKNGSICKEPDWSPVLAVVNARQVSITGIGIQCADPNALICGLAIGDRSMMTTVEFCSFYGMHAGIVFPGIRLSPNVSVIEGNNDLLVLDRCTLHNAYNIVCGGTQPFQCEYRNNLFFCSRSVFNSTLISNEYGQSSGSHHFTGCIFQSLIESVWDDIVYFDLTNNDMTIDACHFETSSPREVPEVLIRQVPNGGVSFRSERVSLLNSHINLRFVNKNPIRHRPLIDTLTGNSMLIQNNTFSVNTAVRIKADNATFIANTFTLDGVYDLEIRDEKALLAGEPNNIRPGNYDLNHFIRTNSALSIRLSQGEILKQGEDFQLIRDQNAFRITPSGKKKIDASGSRELLVTYRANDAGKIRFDAWGADVFNPPDGWRSQNLTFINNKLIGRTDTGSLFSVELTSPYERLPRNARGTKP